LKRNQKSEVKDKTLLVDWIVENYKTFGAKIQLVTDRTQEGSQFCNGFGGIGGTFFILIV
jgi:peptide chain release factor subunit 1